MSEIKHDEIKTMRQIHVGRLLQRASRQYNDLALAKLEAHGHEGLSLFHTTLISHLDMEGTQISTLAERAGMSKQAMGQVAKELEERGYISRAPDPMDKRAVLLKFTEKGQGFLQDAYQIKVEIEAEYIGILGEEKLQALKQLLEELLEVES
jgi:DNA-binding MarR family transcriptional regulator